MAEPKVSVVLRVKDQATRKLRGFRNRLREIGRSAKEITKNPFFKAAFFGGLALGIKKAVDVVDEYTASQLRLRGIAKITGAALTDLVGLAEKAEKQFKLSKVQAANLSSEMFKLAGAAGDVSQAAPALEAFLNIGAARGLDAEASLLAVRQAVLGIDEGTDKLFDVNPIELYKRYARALGVSADSLNDMQKKQAILNAAFEDGAKVTTSYGEFLATTLGKQAQFNVEVENLGIAFGGFVNILRDEVLPLLGGFIGHLTEGIRLINLIRGTGNAFAGDRVTGDLTGERDRIKRTQQGLSGSLAGARGRLAAAGGAPKTRFGIRFGSPEQFDIQRQVELLEDQLNAANVALFNINQRIKDAPPAPVVTGDGVI